MNISYDVLSNLCEEFRKYNYIDPRDFERYHVKRGLRNEDGTGVMKMDGETTQMSYADGKIWPTNAPDEKVEFTVKGDTLTLEQSGVKMVFEK